MPTYAASASNAFLPPARPTAPQVYSVPRLSGGYDYYVGPEGTSPPLNDDFPLPTFAHPNPIGIAAVSIGCEMHPQARRIGSGLDAKGCITAMPGAMRPGTSSASLGPAMGGYGADEPAAGATGVPWGIALLGAGIGFLVVRGWKR